MEQQIVDIIKGLFKETHLIPLLIAIGIGLGYYRFVFDDVYISIILGIVVFLGSIFVIKLKNWYSKKKTRRANAAYYQKKDKETIQAIAETTLTFFRLLDDSLIEHAVELYNAPKYDAHYCNERYVSVNQQKVWLSACQVQEYNYQQYMTSYDTGGRKRKIWFDPFFYEIVKNYAECGVQDYPDDFDPTSYAKQYEQQIWRMRNSGAVVY